MASEHYYNENNSFCAQWLRNLMLCDLIPEGDVDERSIEDVRPCDLDGFTSYHFFAGIGGWPVALRLAGWPDDTPVWTGSCPCQPFSSAGKRLGFADKRHLWPAWYWLIDAKRPAILMGEQVGGPDGREWFDLVCSDMEGIAYACRAIDLPAASVGAPQIRQRLWWLACPNSERCGKAGDDNAEIRRDVFGGNSAVGGLGDAAAPGLSDAGAQALLGTGWKGPGRDTQSSGGAHDPWRVFEWIRCIDGKARPTQPGIFPLAARLPGDVAKLRAYGNAIVPQVAAEVIRAFMDCMP